MPNNISKALLRKKFATIESPVKPEWIKVKISSLQKNDINTDLVDEQIRNILGYGKNNEFIIFFDN